MQDLVTVQRTANKGLGIYAIRDIKKDEVITEFKGPVVTVPEFDGIPGEVKQRYVGYIPDWIKSL